MHFPETFQEIEAPRIEKTNSRFGNKQAARLFATIGQCKVFGEPRVTVISWQYFQDDAWAASGVSFSPDDERDEAPVVVVKAGFISSDVVLRKDPFKAIVQRRANAYFHSWLEQWKPKK